MYHFDLNGIGGLLNRVRLKGKHPLYTAQKHVVAAITRGFERRDSIMVVGQMGTGKTAMAGSAAIAIASGAVQALQHNLRDDQVILVVCPPHLTQKWERELLSIQPHSLVAQVKRHEDLKTFMQKADRAGAGIPKIAIIKRDMTKLGSGFAPAVLWTKQHTVLWRADAPTPDGYEPSQRIHTEKVPICPCCGTTITHERRGSTVVAGKQWLSDGKRACSVCQTALWQEVRDQGSRPKPGETVPRKNPRYRLDEYLKRRFKGRVYLLIWDEIHESKNAAAGNGQAFARLAGLSKKVLALTGTPFNGKASSLFNIEYALNPRIRERYPWGGAPRLSRKDRQAKGVTWQAVIEDNKLLKGRSESRWVEDMSVRERVLEERPTYDSETGAFTGTSTYERPFEEAPGISPLLVAEVLDHTVFFALKDLGKWLPHYEEIAQPVEMDADTFAMYDQTRSLLKDYLIERRWEGDTSFRGVRRVAA